MHGQNHIKIGILLLYLKSLKDLVLPWRDIFVSSLTLRDFVDG